MTRQNYIDKYADYAVKEMERSGVPASITLAQGMLESGNGNSELARKAKNHFGIKCHSSWTGKTFRMDDDAKDECFRVYRSVLESYKDHSDFLRKYKRYASLFELKITNYKGWAKGLKKAGYATNPKYADRLIKLIEENRLHLYDKGYKPKNNSKPEKENKEIKKRNKKPAGNDNFIINPFGRDIKKINRINFIKIKKGDTFYKIAKEFDVMLWELYKYNDLPKGSTLKEGQILYLQPKRNKADIGNDYHTVKKGDTMYSISQKYGIKLKKLYKKSLIKPGTEPKVGDKLWLRKTKRVR
jgi:LysM repeat protein